MASKRRAQVGYRYGRMCLRMEMRGRQFAVRVATTFTAGIAVGVLLAWLVLPHWRHQTYSECILSHMPSSGTRVGAMSIREACEQVGIQP